MVWAACFALALALAVVGFGLGAILYMVYLVWRCE